MRKHSSRAQSSNKIVITHRWLRHKLVHHTLRARSKAYEDGVQREVRRRLRFHNDLVVQVEIFPTQHASEA